MGLRVFLETGLKHVKRRIVPVVESVLDVVFQSSFEFSARIAFPAFEFAFPEAFKQTLHRMSVVSGLP